MQSIRQYRKFKTTAQAQLERDKARVHGFGPDGVDQTHLSDNVDVEKGDASNGSSRSGLKSDGSLDQNREAEEHLNHDDDDEEDEDGDDFMLSQQRTITRTATQQSEGTALGAILTGIAIRKRKTNEGGSGNVFVVGYEGPNDPNNPQNWTLTTRILCTFMIASIACVVGIASAIDSSALKQAAQEFGVSEVVESMATGLFLVGFGVGALFAGPISETVGRNPVYISTLALYMIFVMASALSPNIGAQLAFRFIAGLFGSTPLTCAGGSISDLWNGMERTFAFPIFANAAFTGPLLGPVMGGFIAESSVVSWWWVEWVTLIISGLVLSLVVLFQPETYPPILLKWKAKHLRDLTGDVRYRAEIEIREQTFLHRLKVALYRPFILTSREPIVIAIALYLTVVYIVLFTFLDGYTYIFTEIHGVSQGITGLCFLGIIIGLFGATALVPLIYKWAKRDLELIREAGGDRLPPEFRLWIAMLGGAIAIPVSLFWMGWTSSPDISIWSPLAASVLFGYGILTVFIASYQYIIDSYEGFAASALASVTLIRYVAAGGMTIVGIPMYRNLGVHYTLTILASLGVALAPLPYLFYKFGPWIRAKSKYAINANPPPARK
ncbi:Hypothetical protein R9X50_00772300 [Acrodontium crateriforme]|uniref:Cercosporin MFS transporter CTB4 n=1 Tax=Acrodontium crateriforme TaxID=150365 RepID=A0AAQ3MD58_9PEZI|nr:Hypothetical protein R9X50_00772300 [Acrodontium crateriforme]